MVIGGLQCVQWMKEQLLLLADILDTLNTHVSIAS